MDEIKKAAGALSVNEREELLSWLLDVDDEWDRQMGKDAAAGKLACTNTEVCSITGSIPINAVKRLGWHNAA